MRRERKKMRRKRRKKMRRKRRKRRKERRRKETSPPLNIWWVVTIPSTASSNVIWTVHWHLTTLVCKKRLKTKMKNFPAWRESSPKKKNNHTSHWNIMMELLSSLNSTKSKAITLIFQLLELNMKTLNAHLLLLTVSLKKLLQNMWLNHVPGEEERRDTELVAKEWKMKKLLQGRKTRILPSTGKLLLIRLENNPYR